LYETVIVTINDKLVNKFLRNEISFIDISKILLKVINFKEFKKYKSIKPRNVAQIEQLQDYVSLKIDSLSV
jgi:1-deoxy-D-xylulose-5-phosphate reductoisomerase